MPQPSRVAHYAAFADHPELGNPAGVVLDATNLSARDMQSIAAAVGYSETAFLTSPIQPESAISVRFFAPEGEVDFCGHATIAAAAAISDAAGVGTYSLATRIGEVPVSARHEGTTTIAAFRSPPVSALPLHPDLCETLLNLLGWTAEDLDPAHPPAIGYGGNKHPVLVTHSQEVLAHLDYDFPGLRALCRSQDWITVQLIAPDGQHRWRSRNPFPWGGVQEDPATGAAAAAFVGYLRSLHRVAPGDHLTITQGVEMGRRSRIELNVLDTATLISGPATRIPIRSAMYKRRA
ncbi:PhzF family phenazine biosynthesis protein [Williamsia sp. SKLECPSW1]